LLRKFLVRDATKRATLDIILDDPWLNEGYNESPIVTDLSQKVDEDEAVIRIMETKFHIDRETILRSLRENVYDDVAAIYHLLYHEKDLKGEHGEIKKLDMPPKPEKEPKTNPMTRIEEDQILATASPRPEANTTAAEGGRNAPSAGRRARRFTVSGTDTEVQKIIDTDKDQKQDKKPEEDKAKFDPRFSNEQPKELEEYVNNIEPNDEEEPAEEEKKGRRRTQTIVGIFRRRQTDGADAPITPPSNAAGGENKPRSLRFTFNSNTTSSKPPDDVITEVLNGCSKLNIKSKLVARYLIECTYASDTVKFEVEVCKLPRLKNLHGLRFKRVSGTSEEYKEICEKLLSSISL
jgi:MAP/microtubule affinity-regulating kinase